MGDSVIINGKVFTDKIGEKALCSISDRTVIVPEGITEIGNSAFIDGKMEIDKTSTYRVNLINLKTNFIQTVVPEIRVHAGKYEHSINVPTGNYVVAYYLNGNINVKKIIVK